MPYSILLAFGLRPSGVEALPELALKVVADNLVRVAQRRIADYGLDICDYGSLWVRSFALGPCPVCLSLSVCVHRSHSAAQNSVFFGFHCCPNLVEEG